MRGSEYGEQDRKAAILYEYETFKATEGEHLHDTYLRYLQVINDLNKCGYKKDNCELNYKFLNNLQPEWKPYGTLMRQTKNLMDINVNALYNILKQNQGDVNDALGYKKKAFVVTSDPLALVAEKTKVSKRKEKVKVQSEFEGSDDDDIMEKKEDKKADEKKRNMSKVKCYNCKKEGHFAKDCKKAKVKDYNYYKTKMLLAMKDSDEQVLLGEDQAWMESSSDSDQEINANTVFMAQIEKVLSDSDESSSSAEETIVEKRIEKANQQTKDLENQNKDLQDKYNVLINQVNTFDEQNNEFNEQMKVLNEKNADLLAQTKVLQDQLKNGDQPLPVIAQVSLAGTAQNAPSTLKDPKFWTVKEKKTRKIDRLAMHGSEYGERDRKAVILYEYETFKATEREQLLDTYLSLVAEKTKVRKRKENVEVQSEFKEIDDEDISDLKKITALLAKAFNRKKYYAKPTNNNLRTSSASSSTNKKPEYMKLVEKKEDKKDDERKKDMSKVKCYNCKKEGHFAKDCKKAKVKDYNYYKTKMLLAKKNSDEQVLLGEDQAWMESSSDSYQEINVNMVFIAQLEKVLLDSNESSSSAEETIAEVAYYTSESESKSEYETS
nr:hypothetical protein [Tanacetum cinerariifolium]